MTDVPIRIVERGYDEIADSFVEWRDRIVGDPRLWWMDQLASRLADAARVLELGCYPPETNRRLLDDAGFELLLDELVTTQEPEPDGEATWQWVLARR